tara:strand:+ start:296 stop:577 length:282 start_codon:yes stop_codon:yes gene_type:complete
MTLAIFDNECVTLQEQGKGISFPDGEEFKELEELALEVCSMSELDDNFHLMGMYAAQALRDNYNIQQFSDYEQPGQSWNANEFIDLLKELSDE